MNRHAKQIEAVQWRSARFVKNCWEQTPGTITNLLNDLDWPPLRERRKVAQLTLFHKAVHGESTLEFPYYIKNRKCHLRTYHKHRFIELSASTESYRSSLGGGGGGYSLI